MTSFCTRCGAAISTEARFCTACGAEHESAAAPPSPIPMPEAKRRRTWPWWLLAVIAFFILGLWLGRGPAAAKKPLCGGPATVESGPGKTIQDPGQRQKLGGGGTGDAPMLAGAGGHTKSPHDSGLEGAGVDGDAPDSGGGGGGQSSADDSGTAQPANGDGDQLKHDLLKYTQGKGAILGVGDDADAKSAPQGKSLSANDFTYDKTNLPRYPEAVTAVVSSISYGPNGATDAYSTGAGIVTSSSFDTVVSWYRQNLPPGWHDMTIGDMQKLAQQLSPQSIMQMLGQQPSGPVAASSAAGPTDPTDQLRLSLFSPPAGSKTKTSVMVVQHGNGPVEALLHAKVAPAT